MYLHFKNKYGYNPLLVTEKSFCCVQEKVYDVDTDIYQSIYDMSDLEFIGVSYVLDSLEASRTLCEELNARYGDTIIGYQNSTSVDIVCKGNSKGTGIKFVKKYLKANKIQVSATPIMTFQCQKRGCLIYFSFFTGICPETSYPSGKWYCRSNRLIEQENEY